MNMRLPRTALLVKCDLSISIQKRSAGGATIARTVRTYLPPGVRAGSLLGRERSSDVPAETTTVRAPSKSFGVTTSRVSNRISCSSVVQINLIYDATSVNEQMPELIERPQVTMSQGFVQGARIRKKN